MFGKRHNPDPAATLQPHLVHGDEHAHAEPLDAEQIWTPTTARVRKSVEQLLIERGQVSEEQLLQAKNVQSQTPGKSIVQVLITMNAASEAQILSALAETLNVPFEIPERSAKSSGSSPSWDLKSRDTAKTSCAGPQSLPLTSSRSANRNSRTISLQT